MRVKVLRSFCIGLGVDVQPGDIIELSDREAYIKMNQGKVQDINIRPKSKAERALTDKGDKK